MGNDSTTILLVDDDALDREAVSRQLDARRYRVIEAETGEACKTVLSREHPDCIVLDYRLPDVDGTDLLSEVVAETVPVVMLTGQRNPTVAVEAMKRGADDYIVKSELRSDVIEKAIQNAIEKGRLRQEVRERQEELKLFASVAAHDLRAPLRTIEQYCDLVQEDIERGEHAGVREGIDHVRDAARTASRLIDRLLEYTRSGRTDEFFDEVDAGAVVREVLEILDATIRERNAVVRVGDLPVVRGDQVALKQLFQNLVANAVKFQPKERTPEIRIEAVDRGAQWEFSVADNGIGIEPADHAKIFAPFTRLHRSTFDGTGLGLATCRKIVEQHRGRIWLESEVGRGTVFRFTLPVAGPAGN